MMSERDCGSAWHGILRLTSFDINITKIKLHRKKKFVDEKHEKNTSEHGMLLETGLEAMLRRIEKWMQNMRKTR